ncbi:hypothetical protein [Sorangium sp. So ce131]|uniref:hypothetical protein n=1 Tax=Sorangium sp. So ce131 TaxID=3133282 RepID=UPI003F60294E
MRKILDYEGARRSLHDHEAFSSTISTPTIQAPDWLIFQDPPRHTKLRALILRTFTLRSIAGLSRLEGLALESDAPWEPRAALNVHGPARLPIRFAPGKRSVDDRPGSESG